MPYLSFLGKAIFEVIALEFVKNEFLTHTVKFGKGSLSSKVPGSTISEFAGPGPDSL